MIDWDATGDIGPLRLNPYVVKRCSSCGAVERRRYRSAKRDRPCSKCVANLPDKKLKSKNGALKGWRDQTYKNKISENSKKIWLDPDLKIRMAAFSRSDVNKQRLIKRNKEARWDKSKASRNMKELWEDPEYREKMVLLASENGFKRWRNKEYRSHISSKTKESWKDPDFRSKIERTLLESRINMPRVSSLQKTLYSMLDDLGVKYFREHEDGPADRECVIGPYIFDCVIPRPTGKTLLIECHGDYWHSSQKAVRKDASKSSYIRNNFNHLYELKAIWEHEFLCPDKVLADLKYWLGLHTADLINFKFDDIIISPCKPKEYNLLFSKYHYLHSGGRGGIGFSAHLKDVIVAACVFSPLSRQNLEESIKSTAAETRELSRLCIHPHYQKKNFGSWFVSRCINLLNPKYTTIISYCDTTYGHDGATYKACNFKQDLTVPPDYWYARQDGWIMHKKTLYNHAVKMHMTESQYAEKMQYKKVFGSEKLRFIFTRPT